MLIRLSEKLSIIHCAPVSSKIYFKGLPNLNAKKVKIVAWHWKATYHASLSGSRSKCYIRMNQKQCSIAQVYSKYGDCFNT